MTIIDTTRLKTSFNLWSLDHLKVLNTFWHPHRLIPTLPLRINYLLWIQDLLAGQGRSENVRGIDIGWFLLILYYQLWLSLWTVLLDCLNPTLIDLYWILPPFSSLFLTPAGTGASAVYAVLGAKLFSWQFIATDVDKVYFNLIKIFFLTFFHRIFAVYIIFAPYIFAFCSYLHIFAPYSLTRHSLHTLINLSIWSRVWH